MRDAPFPGPFPTQGQGFTVEQQKWLVANIRPPTR
jgi:hypothetical protein